LTARWRSPDPEQPFNAWVRRHPDLDSIRECLYIQDSDLWVQKYGTRRWHTGVDRSVMYLMLVEVKTHGRDIDNPQRDLLHMANQLIRTNPWKEQRDRGRFLPGHEQNVRLVYSVVAGKKTPVYCYGAHKLRLAGSTPDDSAWISWDDRTISPTELVKLLRYELHPDSLKPMEDRSHKRRVEPAQPLPGLESVE
jgi:hypothetical protein